MIKIIEPIHPFNHFALRDCFYSALFPAIDALGGDSKATAILASSDMHFSFEGNRLIQHNDKIEQNELSNWLTDQNVTMEYNQEYQEDIVGFIKNTINQNNLLMISLVDAISYDPNTQKKTEDTAGFRHWILFYGYDDEKKEFYVIDHFFIASPIYCKLRMQYHSLQESYKLHAQKYSSRIYVFSRKKTNSCRDNLYDKYIYEWITKRNKWNFNGNPVNMYFDYALDVIKSKDIGLIKNNIISLVEAFYRITVYYIKEKYVIELINKRCALIKQFDKQITSVNMIRQKLFLFARWTSEECYQEIASLIELLQEACRDAQIIERQISTNVW